jgi:hypothetical protein
MTVTKKDRLKKETKIIEKTTRKTIPQSLRQPIWEKYIGEVYKIKCSICETRSITPFTFEMGHIESVKDGGSNYFINLRPICGTCNKGMSTMTMDKFQKIMQICMTSTTDTTFVDELITTKEYVSEKSSEKSSKKLRGSKEYKILPESNQNPVSISKTKENKIIEIKPPYFVKCDNNFSLFKQMCEKYTCMTGFGIARYNQVRRLESTSEYVEAHVYPTARKCIDILLKKEVIMFAEGGIHIKVSQTSVS